MQDKRLFVRYSVLVVRFVVVALLVQVAAAHPEHPQAAVYTLTEEALKGPQTLEAGFHTFSLHHGGDLEADFVIVQLSGADTVQNLPKEVRAVNKTFMGEGDPAAFRTALEGRTLWSGPTAAPGESASVGVNLPPGDYLLLGSIFPEGEAAPTRYVTAPLKVSGGSAAPATIPDVAATVQPVNFAFALPADLREGEQT